MSLLSGNELKEQQKINDLELKINREKQKLDKKLTRQKILLGAFLVDALEKDSVEVFNQLKNPDAPKNSRLKDSILSLKYKIESLEGKLSDLIQDNRLNSAD